MSLMINPTRMLDLGGDRSHFWECGCRRSCLCADSMTTSSFIASEGDRRGSSQFSNPCGQRDAECSQCPAVWGCQRAGAVKSPPPGPPRPLSSSSWEPSKAGGGTPQTSRKTGLQSSNLPNVTKEQSRTFLTRTVHTLVFCHI